MRNKYKEYVLSHYVDKKESTITIAKNIGISKSTVRDILIENGIERRSYSESKRTYSINEDYFSKIDTAEKAYYLGFIYGDGCNSPHNNALSITSSIQDKEHLQRLLSIICPEKVVKEVNTHLNTTNVVLGIYNKVISSDLEKLGAIRNKTYTLKFPYFLDEKLYSHFIRGLFDSDGCMSHYKIKSHGKYDCTICQFTVNGTKDISQSINEIFNNVLEIPIRKLKLDKRAYSNYASYKNTHPQQILKIYEYLYKNSEIHLERKKAKFEEFFEIRNIQHEKF